MSHNKITTEMWTSPQTVVFRDYVLQKAQYHFFTAVSDPVNYSSPTESRKSSYIPISSTLTLIAEDDAPALTDESPPARSHIPSGGDNIRLKNEDKVMEHYTHLVYGKIAKLLTNRELHLGLTLPVLQLTELAAVSDSIQEDDLIVHLRLVRGILYGRKKDRGRRLEGENDMDQSLASDDATSSIDAASGSSDSVGTVVKYVRELQIPFNDIVQLSRSFDTAAAIAAAKDPIGARLGFRRMCSEIPKDWSFEKVNDIKSAHVRMDTILAVACVYQAIAEMKEGGSMEIGPFQTKVPKPDLMRQSWMGKSVGGTVYSAQEAGVTRNPTSSSTAEPVVEVVTVPDQKASWLTRITPKVNLPTLSPLPQQPPNDDDDEADSKSTTILLLDLLWWYWMIVAGDYPLLYTFVTTAFFIVRSHLRRFHFYQSISPGSAPSSLS